MVDGLHAEIGEQPRDMALEWRLRQTVEDLLLAFNHRGFWGDGVPSEFVPLLERAAKAVNADHIRWRDDDMAMDCFALDALWRQRVEARWHQQGLGHLALTAPQDRLSEAVRNLKPTTRPVPVAGGFYIGPDGEPMSKAEAEAWIAKSSGLPDDQAPTAAEVVDIARDPLLAGYDDCQSPPAGTLRE